MMVFPTANILLFLALHMGPAHAPVVYATSQSESYVWTSVPTKEAPGGWHVAALGFPTSDTTRNPTAYIKVDQAPDAHAVPSYLRTVTNYNWTHDGIVFFDNGDRLEKHGKYVFYMTNAGAPNEKTYTILFPTSDDPETVVVKQEK